MRAESLLFLDGYDTYFKAYEFFLFAPVAIRAKKERKRQLKLNIQVSQVQIADNNDIKKRHGFLPNRQKMSNFKYHQKTYSIPCRYTKLPLFSRISKRFSSSPSTADGNLLVYLSPCPLIYFQTSTVLLSQSSPYSRRASRHRDGRS